MTTKLSETQQKVLNNLKEEINGFRKYKDFEDFFMNSDYHDQHQISTWKDWWKYQQYKTFEEVEKNMSKNVEEVKQVYYRAINNNELLVQANTKTLEKLAKLGYIEIVKPDETGFIELVKVLNY